MPNRKHVRWWSFRPLSGLCLLFHTLTISSNLCKASVSVPFRGYVSYSVVQYYLDPNDFVSVPFRGYVSYSLILLGTGAGFAAFCFRPLSGLCLLFTRIAIKCKIYSLVSVPFRGYVSYSICCPGKKSLKSTFPSPFGVMSLILAIPTTQKSFKNRFRPLSGLCLLFSKNITSIATARTFGVMSLILKTKRY